MNSLRQVDQPRLGRHGGPTSRTYSVPVRFTDQSQPHVVLTGSAFASTALAAHLHDGFHGPVIALIISTCVLDVALSTFVTTAIVARLWWMDCRISSLTGTSTNRFSSSRYIVIESGAISAIFCIVVLALFGSNNPAALTGLDVVSQLDFDGVRDKTSSLPAVAKHMLDGFPAAPCRLHFS
ncbi:hypothetical protein V8E55_005968 [Tylopilus felleus]